MCFVYLNCLSIRKLVLLLLQGLVGFFGLGIKGHKTVRLFYLPDHLEFRCCIKHVPRAPQKELTYHQCVKQSKMEQFYCVMDRMKYLKMVRHVSARNVYSHDGVRQCEALVHRHGVRDPLSRIQNNAGGTAGCVKTQYGLPSTRIAISKGYRVYQYDTEQMQVPGARSTWLGR
jgi:hypothetical protein